MSHASAAPARRTRFAVVAAAVVAGAVVAMGVAAPASAADQFLHPGDIRSDDSSAAGWHESLPHATPAFYIGTFGLSFGIGADSRIMYGLVPADQPGLPVTAAELTSDIVDNSFVGINAGSMSWQLDVSTAAGTTTLEQTEPMGTTSPGTVDPADEWQVTAPIGGIAADTPVAIADLITQLDAQGDLRLRGYGLLASAADWADRAQVQTIAFGDDQWNIGYSSDVIPVTEQLTVSQADIRPDGTNPTGWYSNGTSSEASGVEADGLHLGRGGDAEVLFGYQQPQTDQNLQTLVVSGWFDVADGAARLVLRVILADTGAVLTLRSVEPVSGSEVKIDTLFAEWSADQEIPQAGPIPTIAAGQPVVFGDLMDALAAHGTVGVLGFGVAASSAAPAMVSGIQWDGVVYTFAATPAPVPTPHPIPALADSGGELNLTALLAGLCAVGLGAGLVLVGRRAHGRQTPHNELDVSYSRPA